MHFLLFQNVLDAYAELDEKIFEAYCEQKTDPLVGALEPGMYEGHFDWSDCPKPSGKLSFDIKIICDREIISDLLTFLILAGKSHILIIKPN